MCSDHHPYSNMSIPSDMQLYVPTTLAPLCQGEREVLSAIPYADNAVFLHTDEALMPRLRKTWSSWNFLGSSHDDGTAAGESVVVEAAFP